jgi:N-acetylglucosaminyl-diphospho-decaprenol L-rhamnosyltransferase
MSEHQSQAKAGGVVGPAGLPGNRARTSEVTAVVVAHNSARHLAALGHALASATLVPERMIVVDNASVDDTIARAQSVGFEVHEAGSNNGFGAGCNAGLRIATTEFLLFCNPDVLPSRSALEWLVAVLTRTPTAAIAGAALDEPLQARQFSGITRDVWSFFPGWLGARMRRFERRLPVDQEKGYVVVDYVVGALMLCRASALQSVGGFDESFFLYSEEEDLCRRLSKHGWQTLLVPSVTAVHAHSTSSEGVNKAIMAPFRFHSLYWYYRRYHSRMYAEFARCALSTCVIIDRWYRALTRREQVYGPKTAIALFRSIDYIRRDYERRVGGG